MPSYFENEFDGTPGQANDKLLRWLREAEVSMPEAEFRKTSMEDYRFYAGRQDSKEALRQLAVQKRPASVYNEIKPKVDMLVGLAAQTKHDVNIVPTGDNGAPIADVMTHVVKYFRKTMSQTRKELECFEHMVKGGRSLLFFYIDKTNPFEPKICSKRFPGRQFYVDPESQEYDFSDARYLYTESWLDEEAAKARWPQFDISQYESFILTNSYDLPSFFNEARNKYRIMECWYYKMVPVIWFINPINGQVENLSAKDFAKFNKALAAGLPVGPGGQTVKLQVQSFTEGLKKEYWYRIFSGFTILEEGKSPFNYEGYPAALYGAYKDEDTNAWFGTITMQKDPQRGINTMRRQLSHLLQTLPKGMMIHESGAILNIEEYEQRNADPSFHLEVAPQGLEKVKFEKQPQISPVYSSFSSEMSQSMKDASGIQNEMMGVETSSRTPGVTTKLRQETSLAVLFTLYDNYKESRIKGNRILLSLIQQYTPQSIVIRIDQDANQLLQINTQLNPTLEGFNDITVGKYDVDVDEINETTTTRAAIMDMLTSYSQNNPGVIPPDIIFGFSDLPYSVVQKIREAAAQQSAAAQQEKDRAYELQLLAIQQKVDAGATDAVIKIREQEIKKEEQANGNQKTEGA